MRPTIPCPVLIGRAAECDTLLSALDAACDGTGSAVFLAGEAGIGKSRLAQEAAAAAVARGALVLRGRAVPGSAAAAFRPLTEALAPVAAALDADDLRPWRLPLAPVLPTVVDQSSEHVEANTALRGEAIVQLLRVACGARGGLLVLEDLHWADPETVAVVEHLSDNLARAPVLLVATVRDGEHSDAGEAIRRVAARRTSPVLTLGRLNDAQVAGMVHSCTDGASAAALDRLVGLADGVPFLVEELLVTPGLPSSFADGVLARLDELGEPDRRVLVTAAAYGRHFDWRLVARASGMPEADVVEILERAIAAQLVTVEDDGFRFRHALTADAVFRSVTPPRRQSCAAAALAAFDAAHPDPPPALRDMATRVAEHAGDTARAARLLLDAGVEALARGALSTAAMALERAVQLSPDDDRDRAGELLVRALALAGRLDDALAVGVPLAQHLPPDRAAGIHLQLAGAATSAARWELAAEQLGAAEPLVDVAESPERRAELALRHAELVLDTSDAEEAEDRARFALDLARAHGVAEVECVALQVLGRGARRASLDAAEGWFADALSAADTHGLPVWRLRALHELGTIALLDRSAVDALLEARELAESLGAMATTAVLDVEIAAGYAGLHDLEGEARHGLAAARLGAELGLAMVAAHGWLHVAGPAALRGDHEGHAAAAATARAAAPPGNRDIDGLLIGVCEVHAALVADEVDRALEAAVRSTEILRGSPTAPPAHPRATWPLLLAVARRSEAQAAVEELEAAGLAVSRAARGGLRMARAVIAGWTDPARAAELAIEADADLGFTPLWQCLVRRHAVEAARRDGWTVSPSWMTESERWLREHAFVAVANTCHALGSGAASAVPVAWSRLGISSREADVLHLVIEGLANREIAERLHLSVRTVEKHVESLLRKTATSSRTQLARAATTT